MYQPRATRQRLLAGFVLLFLVAVFNLPATATGQTGPLPAGQAGSVPAPATGPVGSDVALLAKAAPDECFAGVGLPRPPGPPCATGQPKVNQSYVWGLANQDSRKLWFGTGANLNCLTIGRNLEPGEPTHNDDWVCEYGESQLAKENPDFSSSIGDHRPPHVYMYDLHRDQLTEKTDEITSASEADARRLASTIGLRAATVHQGLVLLGGPSRNAINLFAFDAQTGAYLGSRTLPDYSNIRHFVTDGDALYAGVGVGSNGFEAGHVLRWTGSRYDPFSFEEVGDLPSQVADLTIHDGRIFVTTWPSPAGHAGVYRSPPLSAGEPGLHRQDTTRWTKVWSVADYEPDPVVARTTGLGGLASFGDYLYWGTMNVPLKATYEHLQAFPPESEEAGKVTVQETQRAISIFRASDFDGPGERVQLLYGAAELPAFAPDARGGRGAWSTTATGYAPSYGPAGFGNPYNTYTWNMTVAAGTLYVGTLDWSYIARHVTQPQPESVGLNRAAETALREAPRLLRESLSPTYGADLFAFDTPHGPARVVDNTGLGNYLNYGVRNMVADGDTLYLGMANPMNLRTDPDDDVPEGGWELLRLSPGVAGGGTGQ